MNGRTITGAGALAAVIVLGAAVTPADAATARQTKALAAARAQYGKPYVYGAEGPRSYDCSGLTWYAFKKAGRTLPRTAQQQYNAVRKVSPSKRQRGDLVFIGTSPSRIYHVGIFNGVARGKGWMINANTGSYRGRKVVNAPITEYTAGSPKAYYGRP
jgi:cell wall-associated NlpC family hydrolase